MLNESVDLTADFGAAIFPAQHFAPARGRKLLEGEYRLLLAVLEDAVRCYLTNMNLQSREQRVKFAEVWRWFYPPGDPARQGVFAFESICDLLGIEPAVFRRRLKCITIRDLPTRRQPALGSLVAEQRRARRQRTSSFAGAERSAG